MKHRQTALILALALALAGCGPSLLSDDDAPTITGTDVGKPLQHSTSATGIFTLIYNPDQSFNPITGQSEHNQLFAPLMYEPLFDVDEKFNVTPVLCTEYEVRDATTIIMRIDTSRQFSDGSNLTATDVSRSISRAQQSERYRNRLSVIYGITAFDSEAMVMITLIKENSQFPALLNIPICKYDSDYDAPLGTGPYMLDSSKTKLIKSPYHPDADTLPVDTINLCEYRKPEEIITAFEDAAINLVINDPNGMSNLGYGSANEVRYYPTTQMHYIGFNMEGQFTYMAELRKAVSYAVNRSNIVTSIMGGCGTASTLPISPFQENLYNTAYASRFDFSLEKAAELLDAAGLTDENLDGKRERVWNNATVDVKIDFIVNSESATKVAAAREIARTLENLGITVNLRELPYSSFIEALQEKEFDMFYGEVKLGPDFDLTRLLAKNGELNYGGIADPVYEANIAKYLAADEGTRKMYCDLMCQYILETAPIIAVAFAKKEVLTHRDVVTGMAPTQYNVFNKFSGWTINLDSRD